VLLASLGVRQDAATGAIRGSVFDPAAGLIALASVVAVNSATGARHSTTYNAEGRFAFKPLPI
jgi:carboxypeptidase family protein